MGVVIRKTDSKGRLTLPPGFASCYVTITREGDELRIRKSSKGRPRRYTIKQLLDQLDPATIHPETQTGRAVGKEAL